MSFYLHVGAGVVGLVVGLIALTSEKGGRVHVSAGRAFAVCMLAAAVTTLVFMVKRPVGIAAFAALLAVYLVGTALLAIRPRKPRSRSLEIVLSLWAVGLIGLLLRLMWMNRIEFPERIPVLGVFVLIVGALIAGDVRILRSPPSNRGPWVSRHLLRMCLAFAVAVQAAAVTNQQRLGLPPPVAMLGPFPAMCVVAWFFWRRVKKAGA
ncbi:MAG: hypothetical protein HKO70_13055 [Acidimicrobiia bacterium]|nr:hypothetical protein [Acidimicrobiia bacterium]